jgi:hypothetical protein
MQIIIYDFTNMLPVAILFRTYEQAELETCTIKRSRNCFSLYTMNSSYCKQVLMPELIRFPLGTFTDCEVSNTLGIVV